MYLIITSTAESKDRVLLEFCSLTGNGNVPGIVTGLI